MSWTLLLVSVLAGVLLGLVIIRSIKMGLARKQREESEERNQEVW